MIKRCKGVIFDFNGTLFFDSDKHQLAWGKMAEELRGYGTDAEELRQHFYGVPNHKVIEYLLQKTCDENEVKKYSELKEAYYREFCRKDPDRFHLVAGAEKLFDTLKKEGIAFTIASASIKPNIDFFVESFDLKKWFDPEKIIYDDGSYENKEKMFLRAAEVIGVPMESCMVFEDSESGIRDAWKAGCKNIIVVDSMNVAQRYFEKEGVVCVVKDLEEIADMMM